MDFVCGRAWHGLARPPGAGQGVAWHGWARWGEAGQGKGCLQRTAHCASSGFSGGNTRGGARRGMARQGWVWQGGARHGPARQGLFTADCPLCKQWVFRWQHQKVRRGAAGPGQAGLGTVGMGPAWRGEAGRGKARAGNSGLAISTSRLSSVAALFYQLFV